jgi:hypothetical protein
MKTVNQLLFTSIFLALICISCSKNDVEPNQAPENFTLLTISNNAINVDVTPAFTWNASTDPDNDNVTYVVLIDTTNNPTTIVANNLSETTFQDTERLSLLQQYYWKVIAKDNTGNSTESDVLTFMTRGINIPNTAVTDAAGFSERQSNTVLNFNNKLWVIAGFDGAPKNDVWNSSDGINWAEMNTIGTTFSGRNRHASVVFDNKMWVIGGVDPTKKSDVWSSSDGVTWTEITSSAGFSPRDRHTSVVFDNKIWVIGGNDGTNQLNDVWNSSDGITWAQVSASAPFSERSSHTTVAFDNKIWVIGGNDGSNRLNDVWSSVDGISWVEESMSGALFTARSEHTSVVYDNKIWVIAGLNNNNVWSTQDGKNWIEHPTSLDAPRIFHSSTVYDNKIWMIAGIISNTRKNDVWAFD